jgi:hypothetical protein
MHPFITRAHGLSQHLPGVTAGPYWNGEKEALLVGGKALAHTCRYDDALAVDCPLETKALLVTAGPDIYYDTPHFARWPEILVRMAEIDDTTLAARLDAAWRDRAPKKLLELLP